MDIPRSHTLNPGDLFRLLLIRRPDQMPAQGTRRRKHSLKFQTRNDIRGSLVAIDIVNLRIEDFISGRNDDRASLDGQFLFFILEIDGLGRTELLTDLASSFGEKDTVNGIDGILQWNGLRILHVDGFSLAEACIVLIIYLRRTFLSTEATSDTFLRVHITGILDDFDFKISLLPRDALHLRKGQELNVKMPADLDQFGRKDSHGTVISGEGLVQLGHHSTDGGRLLHEIDIKARIGQIQGRLHSGNASTDHHD
jgi:hypothetical protein